MTAFFSWSSLCLSYPSSARILDTFPVFSRRSNPWSMMLYSAGTLTKPALKGANNSPTCRARALALRTCPCQSQLMTQLLQAFHGNYQLLLEPDERERERERKAASRPVQREQIRLHPDQAQTLSALPTFLGRYVEVIGEKLRLYRKIVKHYSYTPATIGQT